MRQNTKGDNMILRSILGSALLATILFGASANEQIVKMKPMFQSVDPSKATLVGNGEGKEYCAVCGMNLVKFYKTNHVYNGKQVASLHCLYELTEGKIPSDAQVVDTKNLTFNEKNDSLTDGNYTFKLKKNKLGLYAGSQFLFTVD